MRQCRASTPAQILRRRIEVVCVSNVWALQARPCSHGMFVHRSVVRESVTSLAGNTTCFDRKRFQLDSASALGVSKPTLRYMVLSFAISPWCLSTLRVLAKAPSLELEPRGCLEWIVPFESMRRQILRSSSKATERGLSGFRAGHWRSFGVPSSAHASSKPTASPNWFQTQAGIPYTPQRGFVSHCSQPCWPLLQPWAPVPYRSKPKPLSLLPASTNELRKSVLVRLV